VVALFIDITYFVLSFSVVEHSQSPGYEGRWTRRAAYFPPSGTP